ncbi:MAG TPA: lipid A biosynthesis acyltransferase, partial [Gammaproteobacteria bacterium]|nr:lipid A biosynthesis acyltransferase [Gammaproteobacteria bacterium]
MPDSPRQYIQLRSFVHPRYWLTWLGIIGMWLTAQLPFSIQLGLGKMLGILAFHLARGRRHVCETNLRLCFPELDEHELRQLLRKTFESNGIGFIEIVIAWSGNPDRYKDLANFHGLENLEAAAAKGKGILLIGPHLTTFEMAGFLYSAVGELNATYRANDKNPLFNAFMFNGRHRSYPGMFERKEIRGAMRCLKQGRVLWYAPDQDYGAEH